jgi:glycerophosphoryl diester phosphodiesterase
MPSRSWRQRAAPREPDHRSEAAGHAAHRARRVVRREPALETGTAKEKLMANHRIVLVDAHRGASVSFPENTLAAFEAGAAAGADSVEFDVQLSADGVAVVIHDDTVDRTTDGSGEVSSLTLEELQALDAGGWKSESFAGERIPTLDQAFELLAGFTRLNMELKSPDPRVAQLAIEAIKLRQLQHQVVVSSFHIDHLLAIKRELPEVRANFLPDEGLPSGFWDGDGRAIDIIGLEKEHATRELVDELTERGRPVWVWTVDDPVEAVRLAALGVASLTTNDPVTILDALGEAGYRGAFAPRGG